MSKMKPSIVAIVSALVATPAVAADTFTTNVQGGTCAKELNDFSMTPSTPGCLYVPVNTLDLRGVQSFS
jgi:hypothetical protein